MRPNNILQYDYVELIREVNMADENVNERLSTHSLQRHDDAIAMTSRHDQFHNSIDSANLLVEGAHHA